MLCNAKLLFFSFFDFIFSLELNPSVGYADTLLQGRHYCFFSPWVDVGIDPYEKCCFKSDQPFFFSLSLIIGASSLKSVAARIRTVPII